MKKLTVKTSKQTGYKYLDALKVKKVTDALIDAHEALSKSISVKAIEDMNNRLFALERRVGELEGKPQEYCECKEPIVITSKKNGIYCGICGKPLKPQNTEVLREGIIKILIGYDKRYTVASVSILADDILRLVKGK